MAIKLVRNVIWGNLPKKLMNEMINNNINAVFVHTVIMLWTWRNTRRNVNRYTIVMYVGKNLMMLLNVLNIQNCAWEN